MNPAASHKADLVVVNKCERVLLLLHRGNEIARFRVSLGGQPVGHKQQEGDRRTPEGRYLLDYKKSDSAYYKAIHISYPNAEDIADARRRGVDPGGLIMVHGQKNGTEPHADGLPLTDWTAGCIAVLNAEMDRIWEAVDVGTPIQINP